MKCSKCQFDNPDATNFCGKCGVPLTADARMADSLTKTLATPLAVIAKDKLIAGKYRIIEEIGRGGMGVVYKAEDIKLKRRLALKFLPPHLMDSPELKERFLIEAQAAAALNHPNICVIHEVGESEERPYIAMEYVEGETLRDKVRKGPLKSEEVLAIVGQVASGLAVAHKKGIIHRDIKSANIMVTDKGQAKVMDFGLAKFSGGSSLTKSQTTLGTVAYMSPEQARGGDMDHRTDIWSLGVVLYEMLSGKMPFQGEHDQSVIHAIIHDEPESLKKALPDVAPELEQIVGQALAKKPADRYQTMEDLLGDVEAVAEGLKPFKARPKPAVRKILGIRTAYVYTALTIILALLLGLNVGGLRNRLLGRAAPAPAIRLAVLPFENLSGDPQQEYFSDGMTQEMIAQLGRLHPESLSVIARSSVLRYKKTNTPIDQVGRELNVGYVLEGSVQREGTRVRITAELIKVRGQSQLWSDSMEREMSGILALQNEVSQKVAGTLALKLLPGEQARLANAPTVNPEAYEAYLKGSYQWTKFVTPGDLDTAEKYFDLALEKDPNYAAAYGGIAWVWLVRNQLGWCPPEEAGPKAKAAALRAIELDENSAAAHEALASVRMTDWDWDGARESWRRSLELNPNVATAQAMYAHFLLIMGHGEEGLIHSERAVVLDPFNPLIRSFYALALYSRRRYEEAIAAAREALRLQGDFPIAMNVLLLAMHELTGMEKEALEAAKAFARVTYNDPKIEAALDECYAQGGYAEAMRRGAEALIGRLPKTFCLPSDIAMFYIMAGEKNMALDWLEKGLEIHDPVLPYLGMPYYDSLRPDPRFQALLGRMKLPVGDKK
jgi:TolB-like protein/tRNA A-37 threonylcarbamoyl transferase component Bud32/Tfp pilus assembly protein PilF